MLFDRSQQRPHEERLAQVDDIRASAPHLVRMAGDQDRLLAKSDRAPGQIAPRPVRQPHIGDNDIMLLLSQHAPSVGPARRAVERVTRGLNRIAYELAHVVPILNQQNARHVRLPLISVAR
ncbi:MAG TPA: hypothetical protein VGB82_24035 [Alphaproteobacteria bacterium]